MFVACSSNAPLKISRKKKSFIYHHNQDNIILTTSGISVISIILLKKQTNDVIIPTTITIGEYLSASVALKGGPPLKSNNVKDI